jgi:hypothetical protein
MKLAWLGVWSVLVAPACQSQCKCRELEHPEAAMIAVEPPASASAPAGLPPAAAPLPLEATPPSTPPSEADSTATPSARGPAIHGRGFIELEEAGKVRRVEGPCQYGYEVYDPMPGPYAEVLDPDTASPRFIIDSCGAGGTHFDIVGTSTKLPGEVKVMRARFQDPKTGSEWVSSSARLRVDHFSAVGATVKGTFTAVMSARLNRPAVIVRGRFELPRAPDRNRP